MPTSVTTHFKSASSVAESTDSGPNWLK